MKKKKEKEASLTETERAIYAALIAQRGHTVDTDILINRVGSLGYVGNGRNLMAVHMGNLRRKLKNDKIETVRGLGYRLV